MSNNPMTTEEPDSTAIPPIDPLKAPEPEPGLGVDWGSNIDPGPGPDPRAIEPGGRPPGRQMAV
jgi:hypothetical protein